MKRVLSEQASAARLFYSSASIRVPVAVALSSAFGGALSFTILPFFLTALGLSAAQIGFARATMIGSATFLAPAYGWAFDRFGAYWPLWISCLCCAVGCALLTQASSYGEIIAANVAMGLGGGALSQLAQAFITRNTDLERRTLVVSAFDLQSKVAVVVGRVCYLPFNMLLALLLGQSVGGSVGSSAVDVHRYRLTIGLCFSFCGAGCVIILLGGAEFRRISRSNAAAAGGSTEEKDEAAAAAAAEEEEEMEARRKNPHAAEVSRSAAGAGVAAATATAADRPLGTLAVFAGSTLLAAAAGEAMLTAWPLFALLHYHWGAAQWALLSISCNAAIAAGASLVPWLRRRAGPMRAAIVLAACAGLVGVVAFSPALQLGGGEEGSGGGGGGGGGGRGLLVQTVHVASSLVALGAVNALATLLKAMTSEAVPARWQGRSFGALALARGVGGVAGSASLGLLFAVAPGGAWRRLSRDEGGWLVALAAAAALALAALALAVLRCSGGGGSGGGGGGPGAADDEEAAMLSGSTPLDRSEGSDDD